MDSPSKSNSGTSSIPNTLSKAESKSEFIPATEYVERQEEAQHATLTRAPWEETLTDLANAKTKQIRVPRTPAGLRREKVVNAFQDAFELIGGTPRLALWADTNPNEFYRLYAKLLPANKAEAMGEDTAITVKHVLPRGPLDE